jgi:hypothetical protein
MNQKEVKARDKFRKESEGRLKIKLVENQASQSTSDSAAINRRGDMFWIEFKALDDWPKRAATYPLKGAFRPGQIPFMKEWISWQGRAYVVLKVDCEWFLLFPKQAIELPEMTQSDIRVWCAASGLENIIAYLEVKFEN